MAIESINRQDARYLTLNKAKNPRWPASPADYAAQIELCDNAADAAEALQRIVSAKLRPTIRSGGHCNEDLVYNNPGGAILDLSMLTDTTPVPGGSKYRIGAGTQLGDAYTNLYKRYNVTLPGGTCLTVGAGGHICGGGYGLLSRLHGLTADWLSAVDILTVNAKGKVVPLRADRTQHPDLFRACRGAGGGNFGVITDYYFDKLPPAPQEVMTASVSFSWNGMTLERFTKIIQLYGHYWETRGKDPDTWGLFVIFGLSHRAAGHLNMSVQFCNPDGTCKDLSVLNEYLSIFSPCNPVISTSVGPVTGFDDRLRPRPAATPPRENATQACPVPEGTQHPWLSATIKGMELRGKHKSCYMKQNFTASEAACCYKHLTHEVPDADMTHCTVSADSYGGAINRKKLLDETSVQQRSSIMKLQFLAYWQNENEDQAHLTWLHDFYRDLYSGTDVDPAHKGAPYPNDHYDGCYINYPDTDMLAYPFWPQLYYGNQGLYPFLQTVKRRYDPGNIFHHALSVRA